MQTEKTAEQYIPIVIIDDGCDRGMTIGINKKLPVENSRAEALASAKFGCENTKDAIGFTIRAI